MSKIKILFLLLLLNYLLTSFVFARDFSTFKKLERIEALQKMNRYAVPYSQEKKNEENFLSKARKSKLSPAFIPKGGLIVDIENYDIYITDYPIYVKIYSYQDPLGYHYIFGENEDNFHYKVHAKYLDTAKNFKILNNTEIHQEWAHPFHKNKRDISAKFDLDVSYISNFQDQGNYHLDKQSGIIDGSFYIFTSLPFSFGLTLSYLKSQQTNEDEWQQTEFNIGPLFKFPLRKWQNGHYDKSINISFLYTLDGNLYQKDQIQSYSGNSLNCSFQSSLFNSKKFSYSLGTQFKWYKISKTLENKFTLSAFFSLGYNLSIMDFS